MEINKIKEVCEVLRTQYDFDFEKFKRGLGRDIEFIGEIHGMDSIISFTASEWEYICECGFKFEYLITMRQIVPFIVKNFIPLGGN